VNTNAAWIAAALVDLGYEVVEHVVVDDDPGRIIDALKRVGWCVDVVVSTGGLGPTTDDLTTATVASLLGVRLVRDEVSLQAIERRFERVGRKMSPSNPKQADFPEGAAILANAVGTAPGFGITIGRAQCFFMPGVPFEMKRMFEDEVVPKIRRDAPGTMHQIRFRTYGWPESKVGERLAGVEEAFPGITIGYRALFPEIEVKVLARANDAKTLAEAAAKEVEARLAEIIYGEGEDTYAGVVGKALRARGLTLAVAESCTGGLVGHMLTREPGASDFLLLDAVTYANSAKQSVLGVSEEALRAHGAVSSEVACAMAEGARRVGAAAVGLGITGNAGPGGGSEQKPVGLVYLAVATAEGTNVVEKRYPGDRPRIQTFAAYAGLALVRDAALRRATR
jgi:nicotinamide-nucleotide amidase